MMQDCKKTFLQKRVSLSMGIFFILLSMFACHLCSKSFAKKAGLTEHCNGKKHLENISAPEKRKEIDALESAALAQRALAQRQKLMAQFVYAFR